MAGARTVSLALLVVCAGCHQCSAFIPCTSSTDCADGVCVRGVCALHCDAEDHSLGEQMLVNRASRFVGVVDAQDPVSSAFVAVDGLPVVPGGFGSNQPGGFAGVEFCVQLNAGPQWSGDQCGADGTP